MKKKAILGFMTGAAIVAATTGSYAAWDKLTVDSKSATVTIAKPVQLTTTAINLEASETARTVGDTANPTVVAQLPVTVDTAGHDNLQLSPKDPSAKFGETSTAGEITTKILDSKGDEVTANDILSNGIYTVEVTVVLDDGDVNNVNADTPLTVSVGAELSPKAADPTN